MKVKLVAFTLAVLLTAATKAFAQPGPNFHIYLCFGQSNMEGGGKIEERDRTVDKRFQVLADFDNPKRDWKKAQAQPGAGAKLVSPEVAKYGRVTFRLSAANAKDVKIAGDFTAKPLPMVKDQDGVWSLTTTALKPEIYGYYFLLEGRCVPDPANLFASNSNQYLKTYFEVLGDTPGYWAMRPDVPHGTVHEHY